MIKLKDEFTPKRLDELAYGRTGATLREINMMGRLLLQAPPAEHSDDFHFDLFAACCKEKLATARNKGRSGWDNPEVCSVEHLAELLVHHLTKGNAGTFEDIANLAMMLHQRSADPKVLARAVRSLRFTPGEKDVVERALNVQPPKVVKGVQVPVAWRHDSDILCHKVVTMSEVVAASWVDKGRSVTPLYDRPQKPVVLPEGFHPDGDTDCGWVIDYADTVAAIEAVGGVVKDGE